MDQTCDLYDARFHLQIPDEDTEYLLIYAEIMLALDPLKKQ